MLCTIPFRSQLPPILSHGPLQHGGLREERDVHGRPHLAAGVHRGMHGVGLEGLEQIRVDRRTGIQRSVRELLQDVVESGSPLPRTQSESAESERESGVRRRMVG